MSRTSVAYIVTGALALAALSACGGGNKQAEEADTAATTNAATPAPAATAAAGAPAPEYASLTGDAAKGKTVFVQCQVCHVVEEGQNRIGPSLYGIVGRPAGSIAGFAYSPANKNSGITWSEEEMYKYLEAPQQTIPGTKMVFAGLKNPQDRADVIAYLKSVPAS